MLPSIERARSEDELDYQQTLHTRLQYEQNAQYDDSYLNEYESAEFVTDAVAASLGWRGSGFVYILALIITLAVGLAGWAATHVQQAREILRRQNAGEIVTSLPRDNTGQVH